MTDIEQYREDIKCIFYTLFKVVPYHAVLDTYDKLWRNQQHEVSLESLKEIDFEPTSTDEYFVVQDTPIAITVRGKP